MRGVSICMTRHRPVRCSRSSVRRLGPRRTTAPPLARQVRCAHRKLATAVLDRTVTFERSTTSRRAPDSIDAVPEAHLRQMAAYAAALAVIFPTHRISAGLLYTSGPILIEVPAALLERHKPGLTGEQLSLLPDG